MAKAEMAYLAALHVMMFWLGFEGAMSMRRPMVMMGLLVLLGAGALFVSDQRLKAQRRDREANFVALHFMAEEAMEEGGYSLGQFEVLAAYGHLNTVPLMTPFRDGLVFKRDGESFTLEEPRARGVSLLKRDRLVATEKKWPRWERSGEYARKFPGQEVPDRGYE